MGHLTLAMEKFVFAHDLFVDRCFPVLLRACRSRKKRASFSKWINYSEKIIFTVYLLLEIESKNAELQHLFDGGVQVRVYVFYWWDS
jgi:hypothetical protein